MKHWCGQCRTNIPDDEAEIVGGVETGSGPGRPAYACRTHGLVPDRAFIGRRDAAPLAPGGRP